MTEINQYSAEPNPPVPDWTPKKPSCEACARRKVKCDRENPCSACSRHHVDCIYPIHVRPSRRKRRRSEEKDGPGGIFSPGYGRQGSTVSARIGHVDYSATANSTPTAAPRAEQGVLLTGGGRSIYLDKFGCLAHNAWTGVRNELPAAQDALRDMSDSDSGPSPEEDEAFFIFGAATKKSLAELHPSPLHIFKLWQAFAENVNPLVKVIHGPTVQQQILEACSSLATITKEFEALMFSIYCIAVVSMSADDVNVTFGESKAVLLARYRRAARLAFTKAGILRTSKLTVLQGLFLFMLSMRTFSDSHSIWSLCGVAMRIAQRIGLHRDGSELGLSVFETEMRRRLWRQLAMLDATSAQSSGITSQIPYFSADVRAPSNLNDSDLDPRMTEMPPEHRGATEMLFPLVRCEFGDWIQRWSKVHGGTGGGVGFLATSSAPLAEKDQAIDDLTAEFEAKFLPFCDQSIPLHYMASTLMRTVVASMRFNAHHPRQYGEKEQIPPGEREEVFSICLRIAEAFEDCHSNPLIQRYLWHVDHHLPWDALIYMVHELRYRVDEKAQKAWSLIDSIYSRHIYHGKQRPKSLLHVSMNELIKKSWREYAAERARQHRSPQPCPRISQPLSGAETASHQPDFARYQGSDQPSAEAYPEDIKLDLSPIDWEQWDDLLEQFQQEYTNGELFSDNN
ncbi:fungal-specific transcription factor domain-containing protein [Aspergillus avenaceus]|uniref:Fungal-specific transcription factor domain-containing protein n=1 Tax=Aspergillus avenaceus TaxID=36643 RepID=A0A5N6TRN4_ASPAV|nr:fungal-specific transcription factor domain-containing protein [Aspergillus avenaceus]